MKEMNRRNQSGWDNYSSFVQLFPWNITDFAIVLLKCDAINQASEKLYHFNYEGFIITHGDFYTFVSA